MWRPEASGRLPEPASVVLPSETLESLGQALLGHAGAPPEQAALVIDHLLTAERMGLRSHGIMRVPQYLEEIRGGLIDPAAEPEIVRSAPALLRVEGRRGFGQVVGARMVEALRPLAEECGVAVATGRHLGHTGRVGAYPEVLAGHGLIALAVCNGAPSGHWVAPFGGRDGRLSTNPMAMAWPVLGEDPVVADFSTAATAEGVVRVHREQGTDVPAGTLRDAAGRPSRDPADLYGQPRGAIQPLGGELGYRGTALALFVEVLTTLSNGDAVDDGTRTGTDMTIVALRAEPGFESLALGLSRHVRASPPLDPRRPVMMPGDRERARQAQAGSQVRVALPTWQALERAAREAGVPMPPAHPEGAQA